MTEILLFATALITTVAGVAAFRRYAGAAGVLDIPNERSSHVTPTVRGGGLVIVAVCLSLFVAAAVIAGLPVRWSYVAGALIVAAVSWIDDLHTLPAAIRLIAHGAAAAVLIAGSGSIGSVYLPFAAWTIDLSWFGPILSFLWIVWMINAYNFMDGIDGIAGIQAVAAGVSWSVFGWVLGDTGLYLFGGIVAFAGLGFLMHNWSPAAVFMGDVGSAFLGFTLAAMPVMAADQGRAENGWMFTAAVAFVWLFVFDTVYTFVRRLLKREKVWQAHRQHLYQRLVISGFTHGTVSLAYGLIALGVSICLIAAFVLGGSFDLLFVLSLLTPAAVVAVLVHRKKD